MIEYRKATLGDADALSKIRIDFLSEAYGMDDTERAALLESNRRYISAGLEDGSFASWLALDGEQIVATSGVTFYNQPPNRKCPSGRVAYISNMYTYPKCRGLGVASKLFALTVDEARSRGCDKVTLNATEMGKPIYEKYGFRDTEGDMVYSLL